MLGIVHRGGPDGRIDPKPLGESTPSSRILFKEKSSEERQKRQGGAKPGHPGHGRRSVEPDKADRVRELPRPDECPDCGGRLLDFGTSSRTLRDCALYRFRGTRSSSVAVEVFRGSAGTTTTDRYPGYDNTVPGKHTWCFEHIRRNFLELLKSEPDNREYNKFIPALVDLLKQAMELRGRRLPLAKHIREGDRIKKEILRIAATRVKDGALQAKFDIFLEHPNKLWHWIRDPNIPAENNWAERCIRNTVIFRKTGFGPQGEAAMADRETLQRKDDFPYQARPTELKSCSLRATTALIASTFDLRVSR